MLHSIRQGVFRVSPAPHSYRPAQRQGQKVFGPDYLALIGFHGRAFVIARFADTYSSQLQERVRHLDRRVGGTGTNITAGLRQAVALLERSPVGKLRRAWLLSDGCPNIETDRIWDVAARARRAGICVNTIGFGERSNYDEGLLRRISAMTGGRFVAVRGLRALTDTLIGERHRKRRHQAESCVLCLDLSPSMWEPMHGKRKVDVVEEAVLRLLLYKQRLFS